MRNVKISGENRSNFKKALQKFETPCMATPLDFRLRRELHRRTVHPFRPAQSSPQLSCGAIHSSLKSHPSHTGMPGRAYSHALSTKRTSAGVPESVLSEKAWGRGLALKGVRRAFIAGVVLESHRGVSVLLKGKQNHWSPAPNLGNWAFSNFCS